MVAIDASAPAIATGTGTTLASASFSPPANTLLVVLYAANNPAATDASLSGVSSSPALTWTRRARKSTSASSDGGAGTNGSADIWTAPYAAGGAITVTATSNDGSSGAGHEKALQVMPLTGADTTALTNIITATSTSGLPSGTLASCTAGSYGFAASSDWAQAGLGTAGTGQTIISESNTAGQMTMHFWRTTTTLASSGSQTMNLTAPAAEQYNLAAIEIKDSGGGAVATAPQRQARPGLTWQRHFRRQTQHNPPQYPPVAAGPVQGDSTLAITTTVTASGVVGTSGDTSRSITDTVTATGVVGTSSGASSATTVGITASGVVGTSSGAVLAVTVGVVASPPVGASLAITDTITATGVVGAVTGADRPITVGLTAAGIVGTSSGVASSTTVGITATGVVGTSSGTSSATTVGVTATGVVGTSSGVASSTTVGITASGVVGKSSGAGLTVTVGLAAAGGSVIATRPITVTTTAAGFVGKPSDSTLAVTAAVTATGVVGISSGAALAVTTAVATDSALVLSLTYLFTPHMRQEVIRLHGGLHYSYDVSPTVWKDANGVWRSREKPYDGDLADAQLVLTRSGPVVVTQDIADELAAAGIGTVTPT